MLHIFGVVLNLLYIFGLCSSQVSMKPIYVNESYLIPRVVNGYEAALGDVPYQVSFKKPTDHRKKNYMTFCGGVIVGSTKLVSAAHCFHHKNLKTLHKKEVMDKFAVVGTLLNWEVYRSEESPSGAQWRSLKEITFPRGYKFPQNDIAVVFTWRPFNFGRFIAPIAYARSFIDYRGECLVSGYGRKSSREMVTSQMLLLARIEVLPLYWCTQKHHRAMEKFICTMGKVSDVAQGDSGGPLVCSGTGDPQEGPQGILVGIVSGHRRGVGSFFTRVSAYSKFISISRNDASSYPSMHFYYVSISRIFLTLLVVFFSINKTYCVQ
ncbi:hypothetical protein ABMA28_002630 [Loxostege sticticalis]|uniref:Peptidase S1 domain-containing protein n=1 Tax=Loxostege sticticalis TaxID=481309 RepID=A0ABD0SXP6_LOXSC